PTKYGPPLTIGPDYRPYILPPATMTDWANSIFHTSGCQIQVNGVWDPPRALLPGTTVLTPVVAWGTATSSAVVSTSSALPAEVEHSQLAETTASRVISTATAVADNLGSEQTSRTESSGLTTGIVTSEIRVGIISLNCRCYAGYAVGRYPWAYHRASKHASFRNCKSEVIFFGLFTCDIFDCEIIACGVFTFGVPGPGCRAQDLK
ncbi:hypothetical protein KCU73_g13679, partial [Aureobasidium melanogenum]